MTFSIVAFDPASRSWGVAVASKCLAVGFAVPWGGAEIGAIATQALANLSYGPNGLELLRSGLSAAETVARLTADDPLADQRQLAVVDAAGRTANHTGPAVHGLEGSSAGRALHRARQSARRPAGRRRDGRGVRPASNRMSAGACCSACRQGRRPEVIDAGWSRRRCRSGRKVPPTAAVSTSAPTCASTITSRRSPSSVGCSTCTSSTSSAPIRTPCCRSRERSRTRSPTPWWPSATRRPSMEASTTRSPRGRGSTTTRSAPCPASSTRSCGRSCRSRPKRVPRPRRPWLTAPRWRLVARTVNGLPS